MRKIIVLLSLLFFLCIIFYCYKEKVFATREIPPFYYSSESEFINHNKHLTDTAILGKLIFFDKNISEPSGISCASCHSPMNAFSDPGNTKLSKGVFGRDGKRNAPGITYISYTPYRHQEIIRGKVEEVGGFFRDGRAKFLVQQAMFPLIDANEMNNYSLEKLATKIKNAPYYGKYKAIYGSIAAEDSFSVLYNISEALQAFEMSYQLRPFTSKFDFYLQGKVELSQAEKRGMRLFNDTLKAKCGLCHPTTPLPYVDDKTILFTDFSYDNIGLPKITTGTQIDSGAALAEGYNPLELGRFKIPSLRNVALTAPYMHSGIFTTLEDVMDFYNERDINSSFQAPEVGKTVNREDLGNLQLTKQEIQDLIAFMKTLTDGYKTHK